MKNSTVDRRGFLRSASLLSAATAVPIGALGGCMKLGGELDSTENSQADQTNDPILRQMVDSLKDHGIYSVNNEKDWVGKAGSHAPQLASIGGKVEARTLHSQGTDDKPGHFILSQFAEADNGDLLSMVMFTRHDNDEVVGLLDVPTTYTGLVRVYSYCTEHDLWVSEIIV